MRFILVCIGWALLAGCHLEERKEVHQKNPLSQLASFEVITFFSPYENFDEKLLLEVLISRLKEIGQVEFIEKGSPKENTALLISLGGYQQKQEGFIQVFSNVKVVANKFETACSIWKKDFDEGQNLPYPVLENGKVFFKRDIEKKADSKNTDPKAILEHLITEFTKEYRLSNPENSVPLFYIQKDLIS